jgi:hypothetical protein
LEMQSTIEGVAQFAAAPLAGDPESGLIRNK